MRTALPVLLVSLVCGQSASAGAQNLSGVWKSDQHGYAVAISQQGDTVDIVAEEDFDKPGYQTLRAGERVAAGTLRGRLLDGNAVFFNHESTIAKCGLAARAFMPFTASLSNEGMRLQGVMMAQDVIRGSCVMREERQRVSFTRVAEVPGTCPQIAPLQGRQVSSKKLSRQYAKYISGILSAPAQVTVREVFRRAGYGYDMFKVLHQQLSILEAPRVPAFLADDLPLLNQAVRQSTDSVGLTAQARAIFGQEPSKSGLGGMAMCVNRVDNAVYALHLYGTEKSVCNALLNGRTNAIRGVQVNGVTDGRCVNDIQAVDWKPWARAGRNQVTLLINPWSVN